MSKKVNINIKKKKTQFIDGRTGKELTTEEFQQKYGKVKPNLQSKNTERKDNDEDRGDKEKKEVEGDERENKEA